jgi:hypothetical protein
MAKRVYNADKTSYADYDETGRQTGAGLAGTENWASNPTSANIGNLPASSQALLGNSSGGSPSRNSLGSNDYTNQLNDLKKAQLSQAMAGLDKQRNASLSNLSSEKATIEPAYQKQKIQAGVTAKQTARSFDEFMAQRGGAKSGIAGQGTLLNNVAYQGQVGSLNQAEASAISDNARRVTDVNNAYESDVTGAKAGIEAQALQNYITQMNADRAYEQANSQFSQNLGLQRDQLASSNNQWNQQFDYGKTRDTVGDSQWQQTFDANQKVQQWQQEFQMMGFNAEQAYQAAQLKLAQEQATADNNYRYTALAKSGSSGGSPSANLSALKYQNELGSQQALASSMQGLQQMASNGSTRSEILKFINSNAGDLQANGVPVQDLYGWASKNFTWDKNGSGWYDTSEDD